MVVMRLEEMPERLLPAELLERASLRGNEYAWRVEEIPEVIEAARRAGIANLGGQLQFRTPDATAECYWVEVDVDPSIWGSRPWNEIVDRAAREALHAFESLKAKYDFLQEGRNSFPQVFSDEEASGRSMRDVMGFVWYFQEMSPDASQAIA